MSETALPQLEILLAEDNKHTASFLKTVLAGHGHKVHWAANGREAVRLLLQTPVDVVLMDISMPEMDGLQATRTIRESDTGRLDPEIPIIALTAHDKDGDRERFLAAGMNDYVTKPVRLGELIAALSRVLDKGLITERAASPRKVDAATPHLLAGKDVMRDYGLTREDVFELYADILAHIPAQLDSLGDAVRAGRHKQARELAHTMAGSSVSVVTEGLAHRLRALETVAAALAETGGEQSGNIHELYERVEAALDTVLTRIREAVSSGVFPT